MNFFLSFFRFSSTHVRVVIMSGWKRGRKTKGMKNYRAQTKRKKRRLNRKKNFSFPAIAWTPLHLTAFYVNLTLFCNFISFFFCLLTLPCCCCWCLRPLQTRNFYVETKKKSDFDGKLIYVLRSFKCSFNFILHNWSELKKTGWRNLPIHRHQFITNH